MSRSLKKFPYIKVSLEIKNRTSNNYDEIFSEYEAEFSENYKVETKGNVNINDIVYEKYLESYNNSYANYEIYHYVVKLSEDYNLHVIYKKEPNSNIAVDELMKEILNLKITRIGESR